MKPGLLLQKLTTREPDLDQLEVAIASLRAVLTAEQLAEVDAARRRVPRSRPTSARSAADVAAVAPTRRSSRAAPRLRARRTASSRAGSPWSSQLRTASTRWSNERLRGPLAQRRARRSGSTTARAARRPRCRGTRARSPANCGSRAACRHSSRKPSGYSRADRRAARASRRRPRARRAMFATNNVTWRVEDPLEHRAVQRLLRVEVPVDDQLRDARRRRRCPPSRSRRSPSCANTSRRRPRGCAGPPGRVPLGRARRRGRVVATV